MEHRLLQPYKKVLDRLTLFIRRYNKHSNPADRQQIFNTLEVIGSFSTSIRLNADDIDAKMAYKLKRKMVTYFDQCISAFIHQNEFEKEIEDIRNILDKTITIEEVKIITPVNTPKQLETKNESFSALEWATILYYAEETKLLPKNPYKIERMKQFIETHNIKTSLSSLKSKYYTAKKRINIENNYPINKLELIIPFLEENYKQAVTKVDNDIIFLKENNTEF